MTREEAWRRAKGYLYDTLSGEETDEIIKALEQEPTYVSELTQQAYEDGKKDGYVQANIEQESILEKVRAEIKALTSNRGFLSCSVDSIHEEIDAVFDKYKAESEGDFTDECKRLDGDCDKCTHKYYCISSEYNGRH